MPKQSELELGRRERALENAMTEALHEALEAAKIWVPFYSVHEGYAVLLEEVDELWHECKVKCPDKEKLRHEATHVAAMAIRFMAELT